MKWNRVADYFQWRFFANLQKSITLKSIIIYALVAKNHYLSHTINIAL